MKVGNGKIHFFFYFHSNVRLNIPLKWGILYSNEHLNEIGTLNEYKRYL